MSPSIGNLDMALLASLEISPERIRLSPSFRSTTVLVERLFIIGNCPCDRIVGVDGSTVLTSTGSILRLIKPSLRSIGANSSFIPTSSNWTVAVLPPVVPIVVVTKGIFWPATNLPLSPLLTTRFGSARVLESPFLSNAFIMALMFCGTWTRAAVTSEPRVSPGAIAVPAGAAKLPPA